jgi:hypothetical protein
MGKKGKADYAPQKPKNPPASQQQKPKATMSRPTQAPKDMMYSSKYFQLRRRKTQAPLPIKRGNFPRNQAKATNT